MKADGTLEMSLAAGNEFYGGVAIQNQSGVIFKQQKKECQHVSN